MIWGWRLDLLINDCANVLLSVFELGSQDMDCIGVLDMKREHGWEFCIMGIM